MRGRKLNGFNWTLSLAVFAAIYFAGTQVIQTFSEEQTHDYQVQQKVQGDLHTATDSIFPKNRLRRPVGQKQTGGLTRSQVDSILARIKKSYDSEFKSRGLTLIVRNDWLDAEVNAYAEPDRRDFNIRNIVIQGGLSRYEMMNEDGLALVACHEVGHHIGGKPGSDRLGLQMAGEGQADYFASAKCFRQLYSNQENQDWYKQNKITSAIEAACTKAQATKEAGLACMRSASAGEVLAATLRQMTIDDAASFGQILNLPMPSVSSPAPSTAWTKEVGYPSNQCRLDTYFQGSLCDIEATVSMSARSVQTGACTRAKNYTVGMRPNCWFNESEYPKDK